MKSSLLFVFLIVASIATFAQTLLSPEEVEKLIKEQEMGQLSSDVSPAVETTAREVILNKSEKWNVKDLLNLLKLSSVFKIPSLLEVSSVARYNESQKVSKEASRIFDELQMKFIGEAEIPMMRKLIEYELMAVNTAPWPISKTLWDNYRYWIIPSDVKKLFDAARSSKIFSSYMFDLAAMTAIDMYRDGYSQNYQEIIVLIEQAHKYEPKMADNAIKKIKKHIH